MNKRIQKLHTAANTVKTAENSDFFETKFCTIVTNSIQIFQNVNNYFKDPPT